MLIGLLGEVVGAGLLQENLLEFGEDGLELLEGSLLSHDCGLVGVIGDSSWRRRFTIGMWKKDKKPKRGWTGGEMLLYVLSEMCWGDGATGEGPKDTDGWRWATTRRRQRTNVTVKGVQQSDGTRRMTEQFAGWAPI
jgi:hypothetical protein